MSRVAVLLTAVLLPSIGVAQSSTTTVMKSGLHSFFGGHVVSLTVSEIGTASASSLVTIQVIDGADRVVARATGDLRRGQPVRLEMPVRASNTVAQFRAVVTIVSPTDGGSVPVAVLEDVDPVSTTIGRVAGGGSAEAPPPDRSGVEQNCPPPGWHVTVFASVAP